MVGIESHATQVQEEPAADNAEASPQDRHKSRQREDGVRDDERTIKYEIRNRDGCPANQKLLNLG